MQNKLLPPWIKYPELKYKSLGWRMGYGENYWTLFSDWFSALNKQEILDFIKEYPEPIEWKGFYERKLDYLYPDRDF